MSAQEKKSFREFSWPIRVYYEDTDSGGVVYYANYLKFMERARTEFLRYLGFEQDRLMQEQGVLFAVHSLSIQYVKPAVFNDELVIVTTIANSGKASLTFKQSIKRGSESDLICDAEVKIACLNAEKFSPVVMPEEILNMIKKGVE